MKTGRPRLSVNISDDEKKQLKSLVSSRSLPHGIVRRARIILMSSQGISNKQIAERVGLSQPSVAKWRKRFLDGGLQGLHDELRSGKPRSISDEKIAALVKKTLKTKPKGSTHWSIRSMAKETNISRSTVQRVWKAFGLQPHRQRHFKLSTDPFFIEKVRDIVGLYLNPPENAMVLCVDEKSQIQALDRTQPLLPMGIGYA